MAAPSRKKEESSPAKHHLSITLPCHAEMFKGAKRLYSKHHAAERWDLELGSNTTEKFQNSLKNVKTHSKFWGRGVYNEHHAAERWDLEFGF